MTAPPPIPTTPTPSIPLPAPPPPAMYPTASQASTLAPRMRLIFFGNALLRTLYPTDFPSSMTDDQINTARTAAYTARWLALPNCKISETNLQFCTVCGVVQLPTFDVNNVAVLTCCNGHSVPMPAPTP